MNVRKSNNSLEEFDSRKVSESICRAYEGAGEPCNDYIINSIVKNDHNELNTNNKHNIVICVFS
jgi:transcriptional regulator NrdR family protein